MEIQLAFMKNKQEAIYKKLKISIGHFASTFKMVPNYSSSTSPSA